MQTSRYFIGYSQTQSTFKLNEYIQIQSACDNSTCFVRLLDLQLPVIEDIKI